MTGASRGIGRAVVRLLARTGASVGLAYRSDHAAAESALEEARDAARSFDTAARGRAALVERPSDPPEERSGREPGTPASFWREAGDLSREQDVARLFRRVDEEFAGLDGFVGNAGVWNVESLPLERMAPPDWRRMLEVNLDSVYLTARAALGRMGEGGRMVLVSSTAGQRGEPGHSHYAATKGAIISFVKSLAGELGPRGITVNAVAPGWVDTDMSAAVLRSGASGGPPAPVLEEIPLGRVASAEDVAGPVAFLLSDLSRHVTGEVLNVNGGSVLCG